MIRYVLLILSGTAGALAGFGLAPADQAPAAGALSPERFAAAFAVIKPQANESKWAALPWLTNLHEARRKAVEMDRPLLVWRAGGGDVFGRA